MGFPLVSSHFKAIFVIERFVCCPPAATAIPLPLALALAL